MSGGGELQIALLAKAFAKLGHEVVILDYNVGEKFQTDEGIKVYPIKNWFKGIKMLRILTHRIPGLYSSLKEQNADLYYCRIRDYMHIIAFIAARKLKAKFILGIASDLDIVTFGKRWKYYYSTNLRNLQVLIDGILFEIVKPWLLYKSDQIFVQHIGQQEFLLKKNINSVVFTNLIDLGEIPVISNPARKDFVYVGWLDKRKGFVEFFELVRKSPARTFKVIGPPRDRTGYLYYEKLKSFPNVTLLGKLNHAETIYHIAESKALISTSPMEGFPNIYIEAWACGIPVLSLYFDPGGVIKREHLGKIAEGKLDVLLNDMVSVEYTKEFSERAKTYVERNHVLTSGKMRELDWLIKDLFNKGNSEI